MAKLNRRATAYNAMIAAIEEAGLTPNQILKTDIGYGTMIEETRRMELAFYAESKRFGYDIRKEYIRLLTLGDLCLRWQDPMLFIRDFKRMNPKGATSKMKIHKIDRMRSFSRRNCFFGTLKKEDREKRMYFSTKTENIQSSVIQTEIIIGKSLSRMYYGLVKRNQLTPEICSKTEFDERVAYLFENGFIKEETNYIVKIQKKMPYTADNMQFARKKRAYIRHGLSETDIGRNARKFNRIARTKEDVAEFAKVAVNEKGYKPDRHMVIDCSGGRPSLNEVAFVHLKDGFHKEEMKAIETAWKTIVRRKSKFKTKEDFFRWSILSGYRKGMTFRCFDTREYSPKTCAWDYYSFRSKLDKVLFEEKMTIRQLSVLLEVPYSKACLWTRGTVDIPDEDWARIIGLFGEIAS